MLVALINWWIILYLDLVCMIEIYVMRLYYLSKVKTKTGQTTFQYSAAADWNSFPKCIRDITSLKRFRTELYGYFRDLDVKSNHCSLT